MNKVWFSPSLWLAFAIGSVSLISFSIELAFTLLFIVGAVYTFQGQRIEDSASKTILFGLALLVVLRIPSIVIAESPLMELRRLATMGHFLLAGFVLLGLRGSSLAHWRVFLLVVFCSFFVWAAVILPKVVMFDPSLGHFVFAQSQIDSYSKVAQNRIVAATILGSLVLTALVFLIRFFDEFSLLKRWLLPICWLAGLTTLASTQARGPIFATLFVGTLLVLALLFKKRMSFLRSAFVVSAFVAISFLLLVAAFERIAVTIKDFELYSQGGSAAIETPISIRLEMWRASLEALQVKPFFGYGVSGAVKAVDAITPFDISNFNHLHNEVLDTMVSHGLVGLLGSAFMLLCLFKVALSWWRTEHWHYGLLLAGFAVYWYICGVSNIAFRQGLLNSYFVIFICATLVVQHQAVSAKKQTAL